jgi:citrate synthase
MKQDFYEKLSETILASNKIDKSLYEKFDVKRGLRNADGSGVLAGLTKISGVIGSQKVDGKLVPVDGKLSYRGIDIMDLVRGVQKDKRHGFSETAYLLLLGDLPNAQQLKEFENELFGQMELPRRYISTNILQYTTQNIMNMLQKGVITLYALDENPDDTSIPNVVRQSLSLIAKFPALVAYSYVAMRNKYFNEPLYINIPQKGYDIAENFLHMLRRDGKFTELEAELLDLALILHAEHGGGNNSSFTSHVVSSSLSDTYSTIAAALGSLKGPLHGAANAQVMSMMANIKENVKNWRDKDEVAAYIEKIIRKEAHNKTGLVYGMGHAVYTKSDPRAVILKEKASELAKVKNREDEFQLYLNIEEVTPGIFARVKGSDKVISPNVDFFSGFVYDMLGFDPAIYTPLFAMARVVGWCAHRIDELINGGRIIRPAYKSVAEPREYVPMSKR